MTHRALTVAKYFLSIPDDDSGELVSNLKLQKILYYAQGFHVAIHGIAQPLFGDKVYAWKHGPVVQSVYNHYAKFTDQALPREERPDSLTGDDINFLNEIYRVFGRFSAWKLREMTHKEDPWLNNYQPNVRNIEIPLADLAAYFKPHVKTA